MTTPEPTACTPPEPGRGGDVVPLATATRVWLAISLQSFGGPAGQIALLQRKLVDELGWIGQRRFLHALNYCMLLPGPEAQQLATYTGWLLNGTRGGLIAGTLFVLPGLVAMVALSAVYVGFGDTAVVNSLFAGVAPAVTAIVLHAVVRISGRTLRHPALLGLAAVAFVALVAFAAPFPVVVLGAGLAGWLLSRRILNLSEHPPDREDPAEQPLISDDTLHHVVPSGRRSLVVAGVGLALWLAPLAAAALLAGSSSVFVDQGLFFSGAAVVTFGGAYAVLAYVAQQAVSAYGWLAPGEMVRGLALAETTPGPLIMAVVFVAFVGAHRDPGTVDPWLAAVLAALLVTWVTFVPSFVFVLLGAPYVERLRHSRPLHAALTGITAAVVGVIASLGVSFGLHTLFHEHRVLAAGPISLTVPVPGSWDPFAAVVTAAAALMVFWRRWSPLRTLGVCAALGLLSLLALVRG